MTGLALAALAAFSLTNDNVEISFDASGGVSGLTELPAGRELVRVARPFVTIRGAKRTGFAAADGRLVWSFDKGEVVLGVAAFPGGWTFTVESARIPDGSALTLGDLRPTCTNYVGTYANMLSDDESGVALRAYDIPLGMFVDRKPMNLFCLRSKAPYEGLRFGLSAGPRKDLQRKLQDMTRAAGVPVNPQGGAWSLGHEANRRSYLQPQLKHAALDRWIRYARRGGFETIHLRRWMETLGHYEPKRDHFPNGMADFLDAAKRIRAAGLAAGVHTLTGCISPKDPWIASEMNRDLLAWCTYRLAAPLSADATELEVTEAPKFLHDTILSYFGNGNALRIGTEIVQYTGFTKTLPYRYTGLVRGAFGTKPASHGADEPVDYLQQRYMAFYPRPGSALCDALTQEIAGLVNDGAFEQIYMDGSEGMGLRDHDCTAEMRRRIFAAIGRGITVEASCDGPHNWWYQSRDGAWDGANFDYKPFYDLHLKAMEASRKANLLEPQLGWWHFREQWLQNRGQFADDVEYFAAHTAGADASMSFERFELNDGPPSLYRENAFTVLGWYERFRLARAFRPEVLAAFRVPKREFRLRQDERGEWRASPVAFGETSCCLAAGERHVWRTSASRADALELRVEPLYSNRLYDDRTALTVFAGGTNAVVLSSAKGVRAGVREEETPYGTGLRIAAKRTAATPAKAGWVKCGRTFAKHHAPSNRRGIGLWVKGDGSGAVLDVQFRVPREIGGQIADYLFKIDFMGWRYLETSIRERTPAWAMEYEWEEPHRGYWRYLSELNMLHVAEVNVYLNDLPTDGKTDITITDVRMMETFDATFADAVVGVNGTRETIPFKVASGEYATREADGWRHWDTWGELKGFAPAPPLSLRAGENEFDFAVTPTGDGSARARICTFAVGKGVKALRDGLTAVTSSKLAYEAGLSGRYAPETGCTELPPVKMRPGETAEVTFEFVGPLKGGRLEFDGKAYSVKDLAAGEEFSLTAEGCHVGVLPVRLSARSASCRVGHVKCYK